MGSNIIVYLLAIGAVFSLTSPTEGTYVRRFGDFFERNPTFLEFPREKDNCTISDFQMEDCAPSAPPNRKPPGWSYKKHSSKRREEEVTDEPNYDVQRRLEYEYLPAVMMIAKNNK